MKLDNYVYNCKYTIHRYKIRINDMATFFCLAIVRSDENEQSEKKKKIFDWIGYPAGYNEMLEVTVGQSEEGREACILLKWMNVSALKKNIVSLIVEDQQLVESSH